MNPRSHRFVVLDGVRGLAAVAVMLGHAGYRHGWLLAQFNLAVDLFFILSGFVLSHAYGNRLATDLRPGRFVVLRLIRLYPCYAVGNLIAVALLVAAAFLAETAPGYRWWDIALLAALMLPMLNAPREVFPLNSPTWSLFYELVVNIVFAFSFRRLTTPVVIAIVAIMAALHVAWSIHAGTAALGWDRATFFGGVPRVGFGFFAGVLIHRLYESGALRFRVGAMALLAYAFVLLFVGPPGEDQLWFSLPVVLLGMPLLIILGSQAEADGRLARLLAFAGALSYPLYAVHVPVQYWWAPIAERLPLPQDLLGAMGVLVACAVAFLVERLIDAPVRRWLAINLSRRKVAALG
jgi:peptidoglycan/LPS O-acetylase OafA/YrhL